MTAAQETVAIFLYGRRDRIPKTWGAMKGALKRRGKRREKKINRIDLAYGYREFMTVDEVVQNAEAALSHLAAKASDTQIARMKENDALCVERKEWADMRLLGPLIPAEGQVWNDSLQKNPRVNLEFGLPTFAFVGLRTDRSEKNAAKHVFFILRKLTFPPPLYRFRTPGHAYELQEVYHWKHDSKEDSFRAMVSICPETGKIDVMEYLTEHYLYIPRRKGRSHGRGNGYKTVRWIKSGYNMFMSPADRKSEKWTAPTVAAMMINTFQQIESSWYLSASDSRGRVNFMLTMEEALKLFKDRQTALTPSGKRKKIIHWVSAHHRHLKGGKQSNVKTHLRGERHFKWRDLDISIYLPGKHIDMITELGPEVCQTIGNPPFWARISPKMFRVWADREERRNNKAMKRFDDTITNPHTGEVVHISRMSDESRAVANKLHDRYAGNVLK
jgi:hypothetical protein